MPREAMRRLADVAQRVWLEDPPAMVPLPAEARLLAVPRLRSVVLNVQLYGTKIATFTLSHFDGNNKVLISSNVSVAHAYRGQGIGTALCQFRMHVAREAGYRALLCTARLDNEPQQRILTRLGWRPLLIVGEAALYGHDLTEEVVA